MARVEDWLTTLSLAERWYAIHLRVPLEQPLVCAELPASWGSADDIRRRSALGRARWREIECGDTRNHYGEWIPR